MSESPFPSDNARKAMNGTSLDFATRATAAVSMSSASYASGVDGGAAKYPAMKFGSTKGSAPGTKRSASAAETPEALHGRHPKTSPPEGAHGSARPPNGSEVRPSPPMMTSG